MKRKFLLNIALALMYSTAVAQHPTLTLMEDSVYQKHRTEIERQARYMADEYVFRMRLDYMIPQSRLPKIERLLLDRETRKACYDFAQMSVKQRVLKKVGIEEAYRDSTDMILIPYYYNKISGENISYALYLAETLGIDKAQYSFLMDKALDMAKRMRKNRDLNVWNEEINILRKTLNTGQIDTLFRYKHAKEVKRQLNEAWTRLTAEGLAGQLDSIMDIKYAYFYYQERHKIKDLYRYYGTSQKKYMAELEKQKPPLVKMLDALDKKARMKAEEKKSGAIGKEFVW